jgi:non-specific serine/threonine protein kinase
VATSLVNDFVDGVWLVDLEPLTVPDLLAQTVATALGIREGGQRSARDVLLDALRDRQLMLVLDTCEHLVDSCAALVADLLREAPELRIVATSREALGVAGERVYRVASLPVPELRQPGDSASESDATRLFVERARAADPDFPDTTANADRIARICRRLDGIPLAIELAAARVVVLSPEQIEARLDDRFRLLTGGARTAVARQRTLEATVEWSCQLLSDAERLLLSRLSVFPASWSLEAAEYVCGGTIDGRDVLDLLAELVSKSLVVVDHRSVGERRYRFLETIRQFARQRLVQDEESADLRRRHFDFFFREFRGALPILRHHHQLPLLRRIGLERDNLRSALEWGLSSSDDPGPGVELAGALFWFWTKRGLYEEGRLWLERAVAAATPQDGRLRAIVLIGLAHMHHFQGRPYDDLVSETLVLGRRDEDPWTMSFALFMQALAAFERGDHLEAQTRAEEARAAAGPSEELLVQHAGPLLIRASIAVSRGEYDVAEQGYEQAIDASRRSGEAWGLGILLSAGAGLRIVRGEFAQAHAQVSEALSIYQELEDPRGIAWSLDVFAGLLAAGGRVEEGARSWGAADRLLDTVGGALAPEIRWVRARYLDPARMSLGAERFDAARAAGRETPIADAITRAHAQAGDLCQ